MRAIRTTILIATAGAATMLGMHLPAGRADDDTPAANASNRSQPTTMPSPSDAEAALLRAHLDRMGRIDRLLARARIAALAGNVSAAATIDDVARLISEDQAAMRLYLAEVVATGAQRQQRIADIDQDLGQIQDRLSTQPDDASLARKVRQIREKLQGVNEQATPGYSRP